MPACPTRAEQKRVLGALGVDLTTFGACWSDKLTKAKRHRTAGQTQLTGRNDLIRAVQRGDTVVVADPLCLGVSAQDAAWFLDRMGECGVSVLINGDLRKIEPGDDASEVIGDFARRKGNYAAAKSRGRV